MTYFAIIFSIIFKRYIISSNIDQVLILFILLFNNDKEFMIHLTLKWKHSNYKPGKSLTAKYGTQIENSFDWMWIVLSTNMLHTWRKVIYHFSGASLSKRKHLLCPFLEMIQIPFWFLFLSSSDVLLVGRRGGGDGIWEDGLLGKTFWGYLLDVFPKTQGAMYVTQQFHCYY